MAKGKKKAATKKTQKKAKPRKAQATATATAAAPAKKPPVAFMHKANGDLFYCRGKRVGQHVGSINCQKVKQGSSIDPASGRLVPPPGPKASCTPGAAGGVVVEVANAKFDCKGHVSDRGGVTLSCDRVRVPRPASPTTVVLAPGQHATIKVDSTAFDVHPEAGPKGFVLRQRKLPPQTSAGFGSWGFGRRW